MSDSRTLKFDEIDKFNDDRITCLHNIKINVPVLHNGKWATDYPFEHYPNYCTGPGIAFTRSGKWLLFVFYPKNQRTGLFIVNK